jgi:hypothetical protein
MVVSTSAVIASLPGYGTRDQVSLAEFKRAGLETLSPLSWIRSHAAYSERDSKSCPNPFDEEAVCKSCGADVVAMGAPSKVAPTAPALEYVRIVSRVKPHNTRKSAVYFCFNCAADRAAMVASVGKIKHLSGTVAKDGLDVWNFIATTIAEDRMSRVAGYDGPNLRLHAGISFNPTGNHAAYRTTIGGRIAYYNQVRVAQIVNETARVEAAKAAQLARQAKEAEKQKLAAAAAKAAKVAKPKTPAKPKVAPKPPTTA